MSKRVFFILWVVVFVPALLIRLHPTTSESFQYDAVVSQIAANAGATHNALDTGDAFVLRRFHPPLLSYIIELNNRIFGNDPFGARIFSILFGALTCLLVAMAVAVIVRPLPGGLAWAVIAGWLLCLMPVHLYVSKTSNWDAVYGFFATGCLVCLGLYAAKETTKQLYAAAIFGALAFLTCELGISLLPAAIFAMLSDRARLPWRSLARRWTTAFLVFAAVIALCWPGGFLRFDLVRMMLYRWRDSAVDQRNLPWYRFYTELFSQAPAFTLFMIFSVVATFLPRIMNRGPKQPDPAALAVLPFWIYVATAFVLSLKERLVYVHHIVDMFPPLTAAACIGVAARSAELSQKNRRWMLGLGVAAVALSVFAAMNPDPEVTGPQEHPGWLGVSDVLRGYPGARIYCHDTLVLGYYLPAASIEGGKSRFWTSEDVEAAKRGNYDFVVFDRAKLNDNYPTPERIVATLAPNYRLKSVVTHRRTGQPIAWILSRAQ